MRWYSDIVNNIIMFIVCITQDNGLTALHYAANFDKVDIVRVLLEGGADMEIKHKVSAWFSNYG